MEPRMETVDCSDAGSYELLAPAGPIPAESYGTRCKRVRLADVTAFQRASRIAHPTESRNLDLTPADRQAIVRRALAKLRQRQNARAASRPTAS